MDNCAKNCGIQANAVCANIKLNSIWYPKHFESIQWFPRDTIVALILIGRLWNICKNFIVFQVDEIEEKLGLLVQMYEEDRQSRLQAAAAAQAAAVLVTANNHRQPPGGGAPRGGGGPPPPPPAPSGLITYVSTVYSVTATHKKNIKPTTTLQSKMNGI